MSSLLGNWLIMKLNNKGIFKANEHLYLRQMSNKCSFALYSYAVKSQWEP